MGRRAENKYIFAPEGRRRRERSHGFRSALLVFLPLLAALLLVSNYIVSNRIRLEKVNLTILNLPADLEQYSILHLSDLHGAEFGERQKAVANALGTTRYSCVVMTGDMLGPDQNPDALLDLIALMPASTPKYYIPGDTDGDYLDSWAHDSLSVHTFWADRLREAGVTILDVPVAETRGKGTIWFVPEELYTLDLDRMEEVYTAQLADMNRRATALTADDAARRRVLEYELDRMRRIREAREQFRPEDIQIVLTHVPLTEDYVRDMMSWGGKEDVFSMRYAGLILAGHYNGGQWRVPFRGALYVPELGFFPEEGLIQGLSYVEGIPQYISPGMGSAPQYGNLSGRVFNPPAVTLITLSRKAVK